MIVVKVELHSAITGNVTEIARADICNVGGTKELGDYKVRKYWGKRGDQLALRRVDNVGEVNSHARLRLHVWHLVAKALHSMGYGK